MASAGDSGRTALQNQLLAATKEFNKARGTSDLKYWWRPRKTCVALLARPSGGRDSKQVIVGTFYSAAQVKQSGPLGPGARAVARDEADVLQPAGGEGAGHRHGAVRGVAAEEEGRISTERVGATIVNPGGFC